MASGDLKDIFKSIIMDFHRRTLPRVRPRLLDVPLNSGKIVSIIGARRSGKTYLLYCLITKLLEQTRRENILYVNFEDERLTLGKEDLGLLLEAYYELYPDAAGDLYLFFDEIQRIPGWEEFVRRVYDTVTKNVYVSGSSSKLLSREIATSLRGRAVSYELYPLSFREYLSFKDADYGDAHSLKNKSRIISLFRSYLSDGGFPETVGMDDDVRRRTLQSYLDVMIYRDVIERYEIRNPAAVKAFMNKALANTARKFSVNKQYLEMKSQGYKVGKDQLYEYLSYFEDCFMVYAVPVCSASASVRNLTEKKIYAVDCGLANSVSYAFSENIGWCLENAVYMELRRRGYDVFYYAGKNECDYVCMRAKTKTALQVTASLEGTAREREISGLFEAMDKNGIKDGLILTLDEKTTIKEKGRNIRVMPAWEWMLKD